MRTFLLSILWDFLARSYINTAHSAFNKQMKSHRVTRFSLKIVSIIGGFEGNGDQEYSNQWLTNDWAKWMLVALLVGSGAMEPSGTVLQFLRFAVLSSNEIGWIGLKAETRKMYRSSINGLTPWPRYKGFPPRMGPTDHSAGAIP